MPAHLIEAWPKEAEGTGRGEIPATHTTLAQARTVRPDPAVPPTGPHPTPTPGPAVAHGPESRPLPQWRALLEARWQERLRQITELSLAYHDAAAAVGADQAGDRAAAARSREILRRTVATRRALADIEEALARLAAGRFGRCEQCEDAILAATLAASPEARYCLTCAAPRR
jgi:RNA polymerase-binding transcription factor DksA